MAHHVFPNMLGGVGWCVGMDLPLGQAADGWSSTGALGIH